MTLTWAAYGTSHAELLAVTLFGNLHREGFSGDYKSEEESKGFLSYRIADRRGDHFDHRGDCHPEPAPFAYGGQRSVRSRFAPYAQYGGRNVFVHVSERRLSRDACIACTACGWRSGRL